MIGVAVEFGDGPGVPKDFARGFKAFRKAISSGDERSGYLAFKLMLASCEHGASDDGDDEEPEEDEDLLSKGSTPGSRRYGG